MSDKNYVPKPSFLSSRDPSIDRRCHPRVPPAARQINLFDSISEENMIISISDGDDDDDDTTDNDSVASEKSTKSTTSSSSHRRIGDASQSVTEGALVYLRMRPFENEYSNKNLYTIDGNTLILSQAESSVNGKSVEKHFTFSSIFDGSIDQSAIYNTCVRQKIETEENLTCLAYGTSGSGKTYTLLGDLNNPGIITRALENIFTGFKNNIYSRPLIKIINAKLTLIDDDSVKREETLRNNLLAGCADVSPIYQRMQKTIVDEQNFQSFNIENKSVYIWISFVEIYNENVYDILANDTNLHKRQSLKIISNDGKVFIKGLTSVHVKNSLEAYKLLSHGLNKLTYGSTAINAHSSRSHCIFIIDVISYSMPDVLTHNSYKFCDLAGSERLDKTGNVGNRLKEAQQINKSLMILGRCLDTAYKNQLKKSTDIIPFRESKLTHILQAALTGKEKITMIVNITPEENYFEENLNVLGFSSIAKNIVYNPIIVEKSSRARYSWFIAQQVLKTTVSSSFVTNDRSFDDLCEENKLLKEENELLAAEVKRLNAELIQQEFNLRNKLVDEFQKNLRDRTVQWEKEMVLQKQMLERRYEAKIKLLEKTYENKIAILEEEIEDLSSAENKENSIVCNESDNVALKKTSLKEYNDEDVGNQSLKKRQKLTL